MVILSLQISVERSGRTYVTFYLMKMKHKKNQKKNSKVESNPFCIF